MTESTTSTTSTSTRITTTPTTNPTTRPTTTTTTTTTTRSPTTTTEAGEKPGPDAGAVVGGVVGGLVFIVVVILIVIFFLRRRKARCRKNARPPPMAPGKEQLDPRAETYTPNTPETPTTPETSVTPETPITPETPSENAIAPAYNQEDPFKQLKLYANVGDDNLPEEDTDPALDLEGYVKVRRKDPTIDAGMLVPEQDKVKPGKTKKRNKRSKPPKPDKTTVDDAELQPYTNLGYGSEAGGNLNQPGDRDVRIKMPESNPEKSNGKFNKAFGLEDDYVLSDVKTAGNATEDYENSLKISIALDKNHSKTAGEAGEDYENSAELSTHVGKNRVKGFGASTEDYENSLNINSDIDKSRIKVDDSTEDYEVVQPTFPPPQPHISRDKHYYQNLRSSE